jgi:ABC-type amino acid transport substrate-binding protein
MSPHATRRATLAAVGGAVTLSTGCLGRAAADPLVVGIAPPNRPFAVRSRCCTWETAELSGLDVDVARALGDRLDRSVEFTATDRAALRGPPAGWSFDVAADGIVVPVEPASDRRYVAPYLRGTHCVLVPASVERSGLRGRTVGVASERALRAATRLRAAYDGDIGVERFVDEAAAYDALGGRLAGVVADHVTNALRADSSAFSLLPGDALGAGFDRETPYLSIGAHDYGVVVRGDDALGDRLADALAALRASGQLSTLHERYFTPSGLVRRDAV